MHKNIKITIIIPLYNMENYIKECLNSISSQTLNEIEIICVDDGSNDDTLHILNEYKKKDPRVKIYTQSHQYAGVARNLGLQNASGKYVTFVDGDDKLETSKALENLYINAEKNSALICVGQLHNYLSNNVPKNYYKDIIFDEEEFITYEINKIEDRPLTLHYSAIFNRKFLLQNNIYFGRWKSSEDVVFCIKAYLLAKKYYVIKSNVSQTCYR